MTTKVDKSVGETALFSVESGKWKVPLRHLRCHLPQSGRLSRLALWESSAQAVRGLLLHAKTMIALSGKL